VRFDTLSDHGELPREPVPPGLRSNNRCGNSSARLRWIRLSEPVRRQKQTPRQECDGSLELSRFRFHDQEFSPAAGMVRTRVPKARTHGTPYTQARAGQYPLSPARLKAQRIPGCGKPPHFRIRQITDESHAVPVGLISVSAVSGPADGIQNLPSSLQSIGSLYWLSGKVRWSVRSDPALEAPLRLIQAG